MAHLLGELTAFGLAISLSPLHIGLLLLLLLGPDPLRRGGWFVAAWLITTAAMVLGLLTMGHGLLLTMEKGTSHRTGLDLLAAGALLALGLRELLSASEGAAPPGWSNRLERFGAMPLPVLLGISTGLQVAAPDDLMLYAKTAGSLLEASLPRPQEALATAVFSLMCSLLLLLPLLALLLLGRERILPLLRGARTWIETRGDLLMGLVSIALASYLGWQGVEGLGLARL